VNLTVDIRTVMHVTRFDGHLSSVAPCGLVSWYQSFRSMYSVGHFKDSLDPC